MITRRIARPTILSSTSSWTCPACTRASLQRRVQQRRTLFHLPPLDHHQSFKQYGIPGLLSPQGYTIAWEHYEQMMINKLNELTAGEPYEHMTAKDLAIRFARDPMAASLFNHASMAHNNQFFFSAFSTAPTKLEQYEHLERSLLNTFGSIETLRTTLLDTAAAMFGPGFVWLIWANNIDAPAGGRNVSPGAWRILTTYLAGTPYPEAGYRQQGLDMSSNNASSHQAYMSQQPMNTVGSFGPYTRAGKIQATLPPGGTTVQPVLCVNTWEHVYLRDFGVYGKRKYLADWWDVIDWHTVESKAPREAKMQAEFYQDRRH